MAAATIRFMGRICVLALALAASGAQALETVDFQIATEDAALIRAIKSASVILAAERDGQTDVKGRPDRRFTKCRLVRHPHMREEVEDEQPAIVLVLEDDSVETTRNAFAMQREFWAKGAIVRLEHKPKRLNLLLDSMSANGYDAFAIIKSSTTTLDAVEVRAIGQSVE